MRPTSDRSRSSWRRASDPRSRVSGFAVGLIAYSYITAARSDGFWQRGAGESLRPPGERGGEPLAFQELRPCAQMEIPGMFLAYGSLRGVAVRPVGGGRVWERRPRASSRCPGAATRSWRALHTEI